MTNIISNGSKWAGERPDSIEKLLEVLRDNTIGERFFFWYQTNPNQKEKPKYEYATPISIRSGIHTFFGNFEEVSHVFRIETDDLEMIATLTNAIKENKGWKVYYDKNKIRRS